MSKSYDFVVAGAGVFGAWTALALRRRGHSVLLVDQYGAGNSRASSGGETRIVRVGYGPDELYARWAMESLPRWLELVGGAEPPLFCRAGMLWLAENDDAHTRASLAVMRRLGAPVEELTAAEVRRRWPQIETADLDFALFEPPSGVLLARRAVVELLRRAVAEGVEYREETVAAPAVRGERADEVRTARGERIAGGGFVFACGPWLPKVFPELLAARMRITRQEVFFFGPPPGADFHWSRMPAWLHHRTDFYGLPDIEARGFKVAHHDYGPAFDPDHDSRVLSEAALAITREYVAQRFPALARAPVVEARVCQYEASLTGDFIIDRHPECANVWVCGGGSGHGFKHGPRVGQYCAELVAGGAAEPRFALAAHSTAAARVIY
jgi:glycine/D-amino acid oxidase-like deaminating enzyme